MKRCFAPPGWGSQSHDRTAFYLHAGTGITLFLVGPGVPFPLSVADEQGLDLKNVPRALAARDTRGFIKLIRRKGSDELVGARILASEGGEQIMEAVLAIRHGIGVSELASAFHPYLTQAEGIKLCAQTFGKDVAKLSCCSA